ncbi:unnamed protein product [Cyprideis torosa]|uniref:DNA mismatch repair protein MutS core domain-containing protein n=1 Tax=Cyprideis torosa TaxID=163714 RepID=A0A7R8W9B4_9CRUS|nr:unnamed protein product [Cyprideis torosa]CAG0884131.1 unnamed protein product [Cyprideis torosa]
MEEPDSDTHPSIMFCLTPKDDIEHDRYSRGEKKSSHGCLQARLFHKGGLSYCCPMSSSLPPSVSLLRRWLSAPLTNPVAINARLDALAQLMEKASDLVEIAKMLRTLPDLERALAK